MQLVERELVLVEPLQRSSCRCSSSVRSAISAGSPEGNEKICVTWTPDHVLRIDPAELGRDHRPGVVADRAVALVAQASHQLGPCPARCGTGSSRSRASGRRSRSRAATGSPGRTRRRRAVGRVAQRLDDVEELDDRARPAVREDQRERFGSGERTWRKWMVCPSIVGRELRVPVEPGLPDPPVVPVRQYSARSRT